MGVDAPGQHVLERTSVLIGSQGDLEARFTVGLPARGRTILGAWAAHILVANLPRCGPGGSASAHSRQPACINFPPGTPAVWAVLTWDQALDPTPVVNWHLQCPTQYMHPWHFLGQVSARGAVLRVAGHGGCAAGMLHGKEGSVPHLNMISTPRMQTSRSHQPHADVAQVRARWAVLGGAGRRSGVAARAVRGGHAGAARRAARAGAGRLRGRRGHSAQVRRVLGFR